MKSRLTVTLVAFFGFSTANAQEVLTGDIRLACEAVMCLSSSTQPSECSASLSRYFSIHRKKFSDTLRARLNFLNMCPVSTQTPEMSSLVSAITNGAGRCDATSLNTTLRIWWNERDSGQIYISNQLPDYCAVYTGHSYTDFNSSGAIPLYVGEPQRGGFWIEKLDYETALAQYKKRIQREDAERQRASWWGN